MGFCFSKPTSEATSEAEKSIKRAEQTAYWAKKRKENTEWSIAELSAYWEEGKKTGLLSIKNYQDWDEIKSIMRQKGIDVVLRYERRPLDIDGVHDKTYFIMTKIACDNKEEV